MNQPKWNAKAPEVPVDKDGNWLHYPDWYYMRDGGGWQRVQPFDAVFRIKEIVSGRSAKYLTLEDINTGKKYPMFIADLVKIIQAGAVGVYAQNSEGVITGTWTASKRGANFGIKAVV